MENKKPMLIVLEGIDGSGKTTQWELLGNYLKTLFPVLPIAFPDYASPSSGLVKLYLAGEIGTGEEVNVYAASSFYAADRYISFKKHWEKDYLQGKIVLAARYTTSNIVHQMPRLPKEQWEEYLDWIYDNEYEKMQLPIPNLVIYLDMLPIISQNLLEKRYAGDNKKKDILEKDVVYMERCREGALYAAKKLSWKVVPCVSQGELRDMESIQADIQEIVRCHLAQ